MKIVQTYWSKPSIYPNNSSLNRNNGGWPDKSFHAASWALSFFQLKKYYSDIHLYTDYEGKKWLIDELQLPYSKVHVVLNQFDYLPVTLWAIPKIFVYSQQNEPFLHIDSDVFIWQKFQNKIINGRIVAQSFDFNRDFYKNAITIAQMGFIKKICKSLNFDVTKNEINGVNAGVLGGNDYFVFKHFGKLIFKHLPELIPHFNFEGIENLNFLLEQLCFYSYCQQKKVKIDYLLKNDEPDYQSLMKFYLVPSKVKYIHLISNAKENHYACTMVKLHLEKYHVEYYKRHKNKFLSNINTSKKLSNPFPPIVSIISRIENPKSLTLQKKMNTSSKLLKQLYSLKKIVFNIKNKESLDIFIPSSGYFSHTKDHFLKLPINQFLSQKFTLNQNIKIVSLRFQLENLSKIRSLQKKDKEVYLEGKSDTKNQYHYILFQSPKKEIKYFRLENEDEILILLSKPITGLEIIKILAEGDELVEKKLIRIIYDFLLIRLSYTSMIIPLKSIT